MRCFSITDILKIALSAESREKAYYSMVSYLSDNPEIKELFHLLSEEESIHEDFLRSALRKFVKNNCFPILQYPVEGEIRIIELINKFKKHKSISLNTFEYASIKTAVEIEKKIIKLYRSHQRVLTDSEEKKLFGYLARWEELHHQALFTLSEKVSDK